MRKVVFILFLISFCADILYGLESRKNFVYLSLLSQNGISKRYLSKDTSFIYVYTWNPVLIDWEESYAQFTIYEQGRKIEYLYLTWKNQKWSNQRRSVLAYDEKENLITEIFQDWNFELSIWETSYGLFWERDYVSNTTITYYKYWDKVANAWITGHGSMSEYLFNGNDTIILNKLLDLPANSWTNNTLHTKRYNDDGYLILEVKDSWNGTSWSNAYSIVYSYYGNDLLKEILHKGNYSYRELFFYNTEHKLIEKIIQIWKEHHWINNNQYIFIYDHNGNKIENFMHLWDEEKDEWKTIKGNRKAYVYNTNNLLIEKYWNYYDFYWNRTDSLRLKVKYDQNSVKTEEITQYWNTNTSLWTNREKKIYESSKVIDTISKENSIYFIMPNPYSQCNLISIYGLNIKKSYRIELYDLTGKEVYNRNINGNENFSIDNHLLKGLYLLIIRDKNELLHVQKIIIEK